VLSFYSRPYSKFIFPRLSSKKPVRDGFVLMNLGRLFIGENFKGEVPVGIIMLLLPKIGD
jgi:hypothetical protein